MAENLSVPAEFEKPKPKVVGLNMNLLPPSAFQGKTSPTPDPWKEQTQGEIEKLKQENAKLREAQSQLEAKEKERKSFAQERQTITVPEVCKYSTKKDDFKYVDELINKQACEITELKNELRSIKCTHRDELADMERQLTIKEREGSHSVASLEMELKAAEDRYDKQVDRLSREHERETDELQQIVDQLQEELAAVRSGASNHVDKLTTKYDQLRTESEQTIERLAHNLREKEVLLDKQASQITQLKTYIGETENLPKPSDITRRENESLSTKVKAYESQVEKLQSSVQLLNIRLNSTNEILKLQEKDISKSSSEGDNKKSESLLLTRWREKVFALMVQQKSTDIVRQNDENNWNSKLKDLEGQLSSAKNRIEQLGHSLQDKEAQLNMQTTHAQQLQGELCGAQQIALCLDDHVQENVNNASLLQQFAASIGSKFDENMEAMTTCMSTLKSYGQRVSFASGRVEMLQGLFARREAMVRLQNERGDVPEKDITESVVHQESYQNREECAVLRGELERVTRERDSLSAQIKKDCNTWDSKIANIRAEVADEVETLEQTKTDLESIVQDKNRKLTELSDQLECCQSDLDFANQSIEELKATLAKQEMNMNEALEEQKKEVEGHMSDRLADLDRQLNDAKREHTKAVVSLRQLERQSGRERDRAKEQLATMEEHYTRQIALLTDRLRATESERNLMMATLRQEGLIGKLKSDRLEPVRTDWSITEPVQEHTESEVGERAVFSHSEMGKMGEAIDVFQTRPDQDSESTEENITSVLDDLKSLTDAVLKDGDSESGSDLDV
ncbi:coiled-coil alpha-helical rod protein 1-like [Mya arenaria]|uniref:coiled-coil alpha-helical rod protein 1-like n=1 Tax=Mya arenaria TaxID=6604 RepID=UPI0022E59949|nr:coiled-coil alpha-helical rod protein 1-like [Mya arenaria]